jgi:hypothetical protein
VFITGGNEKRPDWLAMFHATAMPEREISNENQRAALMRRPQTASKQVAVMSLDIEHSLARPLANQGGF